MPPLFIKTYTNTQAASVNRMLRMIVVALPALACHAGILLLLTTISLQNVLAQTSPSAQYQIYTLKHKSVDEVEKTLAQMLAGFGNETHLVGDRSKNQILLRGPRKAQDIARQLIESIDRPPAVAAHAGAQASNVKTTVATYRCAPAQLDSVAQELRVQFGQIDNVRIATDRPSSQLFVLAPETTHAQIAARLKTMGVGGAQQPSTLQTPARLPSQGIVQQNSRPQVAGRLLPREQFVPLVRSRIEQVEPKLTALLGDRLRLNSSQGTVPGYVFADAGGQSVELIVDRRRNGVMLCGTQALVDQMTRLLENLDAGGRNPEQTTRVVPIRRANPVKVRRALEAYRSDRVMPLPKSAKPIEPVPSARPLKDNAPKSGDQQSRLNSRPRFNDAGVNLASYEMATTMLQSAPEAMAAPRGVAAPGGGPMGGRPMGVDPRVQSLRGQQADADRRNQNLRELGSDVEVEILPDLDVIILHGRERDVKEMTRIIEEIERISAEAEPVIEVLPLAHVSSKAMASIIKQVSDDLIGGTQGRVSVNALEKPNALLLIGWGEAMKSIAKLVAELDQPVVPETQFRVFRLRHAVALQVRATVGQFFQNRSGLGPEARVVTDPRTNSVIVQASPRDMGEVAALIANIDSPSSDAVSRARIFKLTNSLAADLGGTLRAAINAAQSGSGTLGGKSTVLEIVAVDAAGQRLLKSGILSDIEIVPDVRTNSLVITAPVESMELIGALIEQLDSPAATAQIKVFQIINGDANELVRTLRALLPAQPIGTSARPQLPVAKGEETLAPVRFSVDTRTNSIICTGTTGDLKIIEALLLRLDGRDVLQRKNAVYRLRNAPAADVAVAVNEFLRSERQVRQAAPGTISPFQQIEREVIVVPEKISNSLIVSATPRFYDEIMTIVEELDAEPPQVMIQVVIAEVTLLNAEEFGIELGLQDSLLFDRSLLSQLLTITQTTEQQQSGSVATQTEDVIVAADNTPGFNFASGDPLGNSGSAMALAQKSRVGSQGISTFAVGRMNEQLGFGGLVLSASSESVSVLIRALEMCGRLNIISRPQIMTLDNQPAFVQVGKNVPRIAGTELTAYGQVNNITMENIGLIMGVTPRISPENMVVMELDVEKSDVGPQSEWIPVFVSEGQAVKSPSFNVTKATTTVSALDGETIVLGGLITQGIEVNKRRVPWLSDIPLLGHLFRYDSEMKKRAELLIILTPRVVRGPKDIERIKQAETARMHWCLGDVVEMHGDIGVYDIEDEMSHCGRPEVIYPDMNPRGLVPDAMHPGSAPQEGDQSDVMKSHGSRRVTGTPAEVIPGAETILTPPPLLNGSTPRQSQGVEIQQLQPQPEPQRQLQPQLQLQPQPQPEPKAPRADSPRSNHSGVERVPVTFPPGGGPGSQNGYQAVGAVQAAACVQPGVYPRQ